MSSSLNFDYYEGHSPSDADRQDPSESGLHISYVAALPPRRSVHPVNNRYLRPQMLDKYKEPQRLRTLIPARVSPSSVEGSSLLETRHYSLVFQELAVDTPNHYLLSPRVLPPDRYYYGCSEPSYRLPSWADVKSSRASEQPGSTCQSSGYPPCGSTRFSYPNYTQTTSWGEQGTPRVITSSCTEHRSAAAYGASSTSVDNIAGHPRARIKCPGALPIPIGQLPIFSPLCITPPPITRGVGLPEAPGASCEAGSICNCGARFPKQSPGSSLKLIQSHHTNGGPLTQHGPMSMTGSCPRCRTVNGHSSPYHPCRDPTVSFNDYPHLRENGLSIQLWAADGTPFETPHITERETFDTTGPVSGDGDLGSAASTYQPHVLVLDYDAEAGQHDSTPHDPPHLPEERPPITTVAPTTPAGDIPPPTQNDHNRRRAPATHRNAADLLVGLAQRNSRQRSLENSLERGMIRDLLEDRINLSSWMDRNLLGPRIKVVIVVLVLGTVLSVVVAKLPQPLHSQSDAQ